MRLVPKQWWRPWLTYSNAQQTSYSFINLDSGEHSVFPSMCPPFARLTIKLSQWPLCAVERSRECFQLSSAWSHSVSKSAYNTLTHWVYAGPASFFSLKIRSVQWALFILFVLQQYASSNNVIMFIFSSIWIQSYWMCSFFFFWLPPRGLQNLSFPTRGWTRALSGESAKS